MDTVSYKGYQIHARPYQLAESGRWKISIDVGVTRGDGITLRSFHAGNTFESREEAVKHCFDFGKQIIDGHVPGYIVSDL